MESLNGPDCRSGLGDTISLCFISPHGSPHTGVLASESHTPAVSESEGCPAQLAFTWPCFAISDSRQRYRPCGNFGSAGKALDNVQKRALTIRKNQWVTGLHLEWPQQWISWRGELCLLSSHPASKIRASRGLRLSLAPTPIYECESQISK